MAVRECQGLILDGNAEWRVLCMPFSYTSSVWSEVWLPPQKKKQRKEDGQYFASEHFGWDKQHVKIFQDLGGFQVQP